MLLTPSTAQYLLDDLTRASAVPAACGSLSRYAFLENDHVMIGEVAVRGFKHKGKWHVDERDIRRAAAALAALDLQPQHTVALALPRPRRSEETLRHNWRAQLLDWVGQAQDLHQHTQACGCTDFVCQQSRTGRAERVTVPELTDANTLELLLGRTSPLSLAGTRPFPLLSWSGTRWMLPAAYADLLTRADTVAGDLAVRASSCADCGLSGQWPRNSSARGFVTLCPACARAKYRPYTGHLARTLYTALSPATRADAYLCCLCQEPRRAYYWDHCHELEHGKVRGPVCASCSTLESGGWYYLQTPGAMSHLLRCIDCRREGTLPAHHRARLVRDLLKPDAHTDCGREPYRDHARSEPDGSVSVALSCDHGLVTRRWEQVVSAADVTRLVRAVVTRALQEQDTAENG
ncbi:endonuclease domain-containing protein [Streptomyces sp. NPDC056486]|uniref:endonuclease domain-containing protein n=1 Tax=Streptomyces sp. NPDC056486 TaxID=3345835 RepID=UPI0036838691